MKALTEDEIRASIVNAAPGEIDRMPLPGLHETVWADREYLGWRDARARQLGYLVFWRDDTPLGFVLRTTDRRTNQMSMCSLCSTMQSGSQVTLFAAPRAGQAGREGNTVGTYICADLACSHIIRIVPPKSSDLHPDPAEVVAKRSAKLLDRLESFADQVMRPAN
jgi:hypothetical protein